MGSKFCSAEHQEGGECIVNNRQEITKQHYQEVNGAENILETEEEEKFRVMSGKVFRIILCPYEKEVQKEQEKQAQKEEQERLKQSDDRDSKVNRLKNFDYLREWTSIFQNALGGQKKNILFNKRQKITCYENFLLSFLPKYKEIVIKDEDFFKIREQPITEFYEIKSNIGEGAFGSVYQAIEKETGEKRAIKILKRKFMKEKDLEIFKNQINILRKMDHINIVKVYDIFSYKSFFYVVTQLCSGGTLLEAFQINQLKDFTVVRTVMKQIFSAMYYIHKKSIVHRDMKLENIVLVNKINVQQPETICIKIIDFGLGIIADNNYSNQCGLIGTPSFMPPEIIKGTFCFQSDTWSCAIILCIILIGFNPFKDKNSKVTVENITNKNVDVLKDAIFRHLPQIAKDFLSKILVKIPFKRLSDEKILQHVFIKDISTQLSLKSKQFDRKTLVIENIQNFKRGSNFTCLIKNFLISKKVSQTKRQQMAMIFQKIDTDGSGVIEKQELQELYRVVTGLSPNQLEKYLKQIDQNKSNRIDFHEFLVFMSNNDLMNNKNYLSQAFTFFDSDKTGFIEKQQILCCMVGCDEQEIIDLIENMDFDNDGKISMDQFCQFMLTEG